MKMLVNNYLDLYTSISANDEDTANPATNIAIKRLADYWQTNSAGTKELEIVLSSAVKVSEIAIVYHNCVTGDAAYLEVYPDEDGFSGTPVIVNMTIREGIIYAQDENLEATRYYNLVIEKNSGSFLRVGFLFLGQEDFYHPHLAGTLPSIEDNAFIGESVGFQVYAIGGVNRQVQKFNFRSPKDIYEKAVLLYKNYRFICGICLPTHLALDQNEPFFAYISSLEIAGRDHKSYSFAFTIAEGR